MSVPRAKSEGVLVVGGGPVGLFTALLAHGKGCPVTVVSKHLPGNRQQSVYLDRNSKNLLKQHCQFDKADQEILKKINNGVITIGELDRFLLKQLNRLKIPFLQGEIKDVNLEEKKCEFTVSDESDAKTSVTFPIPFDHLVDASGTKRAVFTKIAEKEQIPCQREFINQPLHKSQGTHIFNIQPEFIHEHANDKFKKISVVTSAQMKSLVSAAREQGWKHTYPPQIYLIPQKMLDSKGREITKGFYVAGELPDSILLMQEEVNAKKKLNHTQPSETLAREIEAGQRKVIQATEDWFKMLLLMNYPKLQGHLVLQETTHADHKETNSPSLSSTVFPLTLSRLNNPLRLISKDPVSVVVGLGDANQDPHFHGAHGVNDGLAGSAMFAECLPNPAKKQSFLVEKFLNWMTVIRSKHRSRLWDFALKRQSEEKLSDFTLPAKAALLNALEEKIEEYQSKKTLSELVTHLSGQDKQVSALESFVNSVNAIDKLTKNLAKFSKYQSEAYEPLSLLVQEIGKIRQTLKDMPLGKGIVALLDTYLDVIQSKNSILALLPPLKNVTHQPNLEILKRCLPEDTKEVKRDSLTQKSADQNSTKNICEMLGTLPASPKQQAAQTATLDNRTSTSATAQTSMLDNRTSTSATAQASTQDNRTSTSATAQTATLDNRTSNSTLRRTTSTVQVTTPSVDQTSQVAEEAQNNSDTVKVNGRSISIR